MELQIKNRRYYSFIPYSFYMGKFKKGLFLGGLLGAGMMWLSGTTKGKQTRDKMLTYAQDVFDDVKAQVLSSKKYADLTKSEYVKMVQEYVDTYAVKNGLADSVKSLVVKLVTAQWEVLKKELPKETKKVVRKTKKKKA